MTRKNGKSRLIGEMMDNDRFGNLCQFYGMLSAASTLMEEAELLAQLTGSQQCLQDCIKIESDIERVKTQVSESVGLMMKGS